MLEDKNLHLKRLSLTLRDETKRFREETLIQKFKNLVLFRKRRQSGSKKTEVKNLIIIFIMFICLRHV